MTAVSLLLAPTHKAASPVDVCLAMKEMAESVSVRVMENNTPKHCHDSDSLSLLQILMSVLQIEIPVM